MFLYNLPKWNVLLGAHLFDLGMQFRHWIAIEMSSSFPIPGRLHPSHYSLLYFLEGRAEDVPSRSHPDPYVPALRARKLRLRRPSSRNDPKGVNLKDVWTDIPTVRHWKFKSKERHANALSTKILDRVIDISTVPGDVLLESVRWLRNDVRGVRGKAPSLGRNGDRLRARDCGAAHQR